MLPSNTTVLPSIEVPPPSDLGSAVEHREVFTDGRSTPKQQDRDHDNLEKPAKNRVNRHLYTSPPYSC